MRTTYTKEQRRTARALVLECLVVLGQPASRNLVNETTSKILKGLPQSVLKKNQN